MKPGWLMLALTAVIAVVCGFGGAQLARHRPTAPTPMSLRDTVHGVLSKQIKLTGPQQQRIDEIDSRYTRQRNLILADLHAENAELGAAVAEDMTLNGPAKVAIQELQASLGQMQTQAVQYIVDVRQVLTPDQRKIYDDEVVELMMRNAP